MKRLLKQAEANKVYVMTNYAVQSFKETSPKVSDMRDALKYFKSNFAVEFPGCSIIQTEGINPAYGPDIYANAVWATQEEFDAFVAKYNITPNWKIMTKGEMDEQMDLEYEKEMRKNRD